MRRKIAAVLTAAVMVLGAVSAAAEVSKQEKVYVVLAPDGTVESLTDVIRLENPDGLEELTDRTMLSGIENLGDTGSFVLDGETLTWQADGKDVVYQGTGDRVPPVLPVMTLTLDGEEVSASELKTREGEAVLTVAFSTAGDIPALALTVMLLPDTGISDLKTTNAMIRKEMGKQVLVGWAVPGVNASLNLPDSFSVAFHADHAELDWAMTLITSDPISGLCGEIEQRLNLDLRAELEDVRSILSAVMLDETIPETSGKTRMIGSKLNELNEGLEKLDEGAKQLKESAEALDAGLAGLVANNEALESGADRLAEATLQMANMQLASSGLADLGIDVPELTADNYAETLDDAVFRLQALSSSEAKESAEKLAALKEQLDRLAELTAGLKAYTAGAAEAAAGASDLKDGAAQLYKKGTQAMKSAILTAEKFAALMLQPYVESKLPGLLDAYEQLRDMSGNAGYDLRTEGVPSSTLYIMRTDLQ